MPRRSLSPQLEQLEPRLLLKGPSDAPSLGPPPTPGPTAAWVSTVAQLQTAVRNLQSGQTIVIQPGTYNLTESLVIGRSAPINHVTIRGATDNFNDVVIRGRGMENPNYGNVPHGITVWNAQDVLIANLSVGEVYYHPIDLQGLSGAERVHIYHVRSFDGGEQLVKSNSGGGGVDDCILEYSLIEYTASTPVTDHGGGIGYTGGLHAHQTDNWIIRHNLWRNFHAPDTVAFLWNPVVLMWNNSSNTIVEGNTFINVDRSIGFGLGDATGFDHQGGVIRDNFIYLEPGLFSPARRAAAQFVSQILVYDSPDSKVYHNTVLTNANCDLSIEVRWAQTGVEIRNNLTDVPIGTRNGGMFSGSGNYTAATLAMFANPTGHDFHLVSSAATLANVIDRVSPLPSVLTDWDGDVRPQGPAADLGADEFRSAPDSLRVTSLTPTATGFIAQFNRALEPAVLNLYDGLGGGLGSADVTVTRGGALVRGSLVVDPSSTRVTFVATGGVLPSGTYAVTLRSAGNGFRTPSGALLDGNSDGTPGDNYTASLPGVSSSVVVVSVSDLARGPDQGVDVPAGTAGLPLRLSNGGGVTSVHLTLRYDPRLLTVTGGTVATGLPSGAAVTVNTSTPGVAVVDFTSPPLPATVSEFIRLTAFVPVAAADFYTQKHVLDLADLSVNGGALASTDDDGVHVAAYLGDTTANGGYSAADATRALRIATGLDTGFASYQLLDPVIIADVNATSTITSTDATRLLQEAVGIDRPEIPNLPLNAPLFTVSGPDPLLSIPWRFLAKRGGLITVPLNLDRSEGLDSADLALSYDVQRLELVAVKRGSLTRDFDLFQTNLDAEAGTLRVALGRSAGPVTGRGAGSVLGLVFRIRRDAPAGSAVVNLHHHLGNTRTQLNEGGLDLNPDPTDDGQDPLDGLITIRETVARGRRIGITGPTAGTNSARAEVIDALFASDVVTQAKRARNSG